MNLQQYITLYIILGLLYTAIRLYVKRDMVAEYGLRIITIAIITTIIWPYPVGRKICQE